VWPKQKLRKKVEVEIVQSIRSNLHRNVGRNIGKWIDNLCPLKEPESLVPTVRLKFRADEPIVRTRGLKLGLTK
jgi:hypothetical protein